MLLAIGWVAYGASIPTRTAPAFVLDIIVGAAVFCCLAFAVASVVKNVDAAQPVGLAIVLPLSFISGVFIPISELPHWLIDVGDVFPVRPLAVALLPRITRTPPGSDCDLAVLVAWGGAGLIIAIRRFNWLPRST